jgi:hypothetical protein
MGSKLSACTLIFVHILNLKCNIIYATKLADFVGGSQYCSIYDAVDVCLFLRAKSAGVFPSISLDFRSTPASMRALMISSGAPTSAAKCKAFQLVCYSVVLVS